jgi:predicted nuclease of predicted toxin-antitoxin system
MLTFYFDHNMQGPLLHGVRQREVDVLTSLEDGTNRHDDHTLLNRATLLGRIFVTQDRDLLRIAEELLAEGQPFAGIIYCRASGVSTGVLLDHLEIAAKTMTQEEMASNVLRVPL